MESNSALTNIAQSSARIQICLCRPLVNFKGNNVNCRNEYQHFVLTFYMASSSKNRTQGPALTNTDQRKSNFLNFIFFATFAKLLKTVNCKEITWHWIFNMRVLNSREQMSSEPSLCLLQWGLLLSKWIWKSLLSTRYLFMNMECTFLYIKITGIHITSSYNYNARLLSKVHDTLSCIQIIKL